ncbi:MAG: hypothetical protein R6U02_03250 [Alkalibacterium sp.]|uniref:hypothetical protein n=1 Tax=Alkalibacterium sp. TaxID=1872447 RepID=UPI0039705112
MKKLTKLLALTMTGGLLLMACGDTEDVDDIDLPEVEEMEDNLNEDMNDDLDEDMNDETEE